MTTSDGITRTATFDRTHTYRHTLTRTWDDTRPPLIFVMLNPSKADADRDDPTVLRCMSFARREDRGGIVVVNLFTLCATDPAVLLRSKHPVDVDGDAELTATFRAAGELGHTVVAAWGNHKMAVDRGRAVRNRARVLDVPLWCLGFTHNGAPRHPLYVRGDAELRPYGLPA